MYFLVIFIRSFESGLKRKRSIAAANSIVNPFIYGFNHPVFREVFVAILRRRRLPEPTSFGGSLSGTKQVTAETRSTSV